MRLKDTLQNIVTMLEASSKENQKLKEEITELKSKINTQQSYMTVFSQKLEDISEINVSAATLIEELAHYSMDNTTNNSDVVNNHKQNNNSPAKLYLVGTK